MLQLTNLKDKIRSSCFTLLSDRDLDSEERTWIRTVTKAAGPEAPCSTDFRTGMVIIGLSRHLGSIFAYSADVNTMPTC